MNTRRILLCCAVLAITSLAAHAAGKVASYEYRFASTPVGAPVTAIDPPPGSVVIDTVTGIHYRKIGAKGSNAAANYAVEIPATVTAASPLTGVTLTANPGLVSETIYITPAGTIAALTVVFPSNANSVIGQNFTIASTQIVTALTVSSSGLTLTGTAITAMAANTVYSWRKVAASTWHRTQ